MPQIQKHYKEEVQTSGLEPISPRQKSSGHQVSLVSFRITGISLLFKLFGKNRSSVLQDHINNPHREYTQNTDFIQNDIRVLIL